MTNREFLKDVGNRVRTIRQIRGKSTTELSLASKISEQTLANIELGNSATDISTLRRIAIALEIDMTMLLRTDPLKVIIQ